MTPAAVSSTLAPSSSWFMPAMVSRTAAATSGGTRVHREGQIAIGMRFPQNPIVDFFTCGEGLHQLTVDPGGGDLAGLQLPHDALLITAKDRKHMQALTQQMIHGNSIADKGLRRGEAHLPVLEVVEPLDG